MGHKGSGDRGRWLVIGIVGGAFVLGIIALNFRQFTPPAAPMPATQPATQRATTTPSISL